MRRFAETTNPRRNCAEQKRALLVKLGSLRGSSVKIGAREGSLRKDDTHKSMSVNKKPCSWNSRGHGDLLVMAPGILCVLSLAWPSKSIYLYLSLSIYIYIYTYIHIIQRREQVGKGQMGSALMGSLRLFMFFDRGTLWVYQSVKICQHIC